jgi:hypothetical protein
VHAVKFDEKCDEAHNDLTRHGHKSPVITSADAHASVFMRGEDQGVKFGSLMRSPKCASLRPLAPSCTSKGRSNYNSGVNTLKVMHYPGPLPTFVSFTRLFACVERTKVSNSSYSRDTRICGSFRPSAPLSTSKILQTLFKR